MEHPPEKGDYCIQIDFEKGSEQPSRVFRAMSHLIESFQSIDVDLAQCIPAKIETVLLLEEIEAGSIRTRLRSLIKSVDDEALKDLDWKAIIGNYLLRGKRKILEFLVDKKEIRDGEQIRELEREISRLAEETELLRIPSYNVIPVNRIVHDILRLSEALSPLSEGDEVKYIAEDQPILVNKAFSVPQEIIDELLTKETIKSQTQMILRVKKPDYLGQSMWELKHQDRRVGAKILDQKWLVKFQNQEVLLQPGDSIRAQVETHVSYDESGEVVSVSHFILEVLEIIRAPAMQQIPLVTHEDERE